MRRLGLAAMERCLWRQRSRFLWLREGDCNSKLFHLKATARRRKNFIPKLIIDDKHITDQPEKKAIIWNHFNSLLGTYQQHVQTLNLDSLQFPTMAMESLEADFTEEEVKAALFDIHPEKAPGPDGFSGLFFRACWDTIKGDLMKAILKFQSCNSQNLHLLNSAFMVLIPKNSAATHPKDFRPISLVHSFAKLITKILALRLQPFMSALVLQCQNAFIKKRSIHDNFVYVQSLIKSLKQKHTPAILLKLDISKAFDSASWEFLLQLLEHRGFGRRWREWLSSLLLTCSTRVLINGEISDRIDHKCGLRQGDPLSPLLFVPIMDCLARIMDKASSKTVLSPFERRALRFRTSIYADDVVIFSKPMLQDAMAINSILQKFGTATGLHTNMSKTNFYPICCESVDTSALQSTLGCSRGSFPCTYLGMPLSDKKLKRIDLQPTLDRLAGKCSGWKIEWINLMGRTVLVRAVLSAMPAFQMIAIPQAKWLDVKIDKIRRPFLWAGKNTASGGQCLVSWKKLCRPTEFGGLGIPNLEFQGAALRVRWLWQQAKFPDKPWSNLPLPSDKLATAIFTASTEFVIGSGASISFWFSHWWQGTPLKELFPSLYMHSRGHRMTLLAALTDNKWIAYIRANPTVPVLRDYLFVWAITSTINLSPNQQDDIRWKWTADGQYSARSAYQLLFQGLIRCNYDMLIWSSRTPPKCQMHAWLAIQGRCNTEDQLAKKGWPHNQTCALCLQQPETALHLYAQCSYSRTVWSLVFQKFDVQLNPPAATEPSLEDWWFHSVQQLPPRMRRKLNCLIICTWWQLWKERNARIFKHKASPPTAILCLINEELRLWSNAGLVGAMWLPPD